MPWARRAGAGLSDQISGLANERIWSTAAGSLAIPTIDLGEKHQP